MSVKKVIYILTIITLPQIDNVFVIIIYETVLIVTPRMIGLFLVRVIKTIFSVKIIFFSQVIILQCLIGRC